MAFTLLVWLAACLFLWEQQAEASVSFHRMQEIAGIRLESHHPAGIYKTYGNGLVNSRPKRETSVSAERDAIEFLEGQLGIPSEEFRIVSSTTTDIGSRFWVQRTINSIPIANSAANVALGGDNKVHAYGANFHKNDNIQVSEVDSYPNISEEDAIQAAERAFNARYSGVKVELQYYQTKNNQLILTYVIQVESPGPWYQVFINAVDGTPVAANNFQNDASSVYIAVPPDVPDVSSEYSTVLNPADILASPVGWHDSENDTVPSTSGNNILTYWGRNTTMTLESGVGPIFNYTFSLETDPTDTLNVDASRVNAFVISNTVHDVFYRYGFTESTFNFQNDNFGKGGKENDRISISIQDDAGINNANMMTLPDGQGGQMRMYLWTYSDIYRDGGMSNDLIIHEQSHGLTQRMTGGGTCTCLQVLESNGMGEGWSDVIADWFIRKDANDRDFVLASWAANTAGGLRRYPFSTNSTTNPLRYSNVPDFEEEHSIGEIWANMLHNVYEMMVSKYGFSSNARTDPEGKEGNVMFLRILIDALLLQPCNPTFVTARDAWIQASIMRYSQPELTCIIWKSFASRGLGSTADETYSDSFLVPENCTS